MESPKLPPKGEDGVTRQRTVPPEMYSPEWLLGFGSPEEYTEFLRTKGRALRPRLRRALELADLRPGMRVLDLGCGKGEVTFHVALAGAEAYGLDYSSGSSTLSRKTLEVLPRSARKHAFLIQADAKAIPLADATFHRIFVLDLVEHLYDWELRLALGEVFRLLRADGYVIIHTLPNRWALDIGYPLARALLRSLPPSPRNEYERVVHVNEQDIIRLYDFLSTCGFASRTWLEGTTKEQAAWQGGGAPFSDMRRKAYPIFTNPLLGIIYAALARSPARLIFANDIYAIAWRPGQPPPLILRRSHPRALTERICISLTRRLRQESPKRVIDP